MAAAALKKGRAKPNRRAGGRTAARQVVTPTVVPMLSYEDGVAAMEWLSRAFGFREIARHTGPDGYESPKRHREHCDPARKWSTVPWIIDGVLVYVDHLERHLARAKAAGATILSEIEKGPPGRRYRAEDLEGHRWFFFEKG